MKKAIPFVIAIIPAVLATMSAPHALAQRQISGQLEEVIVTAEKREQNLQDVPLSVSAMDASMIEKVFARDIVDIAGMSPNLTIDPVLGNGTASISIRGMQLNDVEKSFDPAVAVYQDGIYLATTTGALLNVWDAERIEVLRGPQGTLFGRNTIGGLVHVIRAKPTGELGGKMSATIAQDGQKDFKGTINFPEFAGISTKFTAMDFAGGEYFTNKTRGTEEGNTDLTSWMFSALWRPTENFDLQLTYDNVKDSTPVRPVTCLTESPELFALIGLTGDNCANKDDEDFHRTTYTSTKQTASIDLESFALHANWAINDDHRLVAIYAKRDMEETSKQEFDGIAFDGFRVSRPQLENQESLEVRLESDFSWGRTTLGGFYWDSDYSAWQSTYFFGGFNDSPRSDQRTESTAFFGQVDWDISEQLTLSVGGRYTSEDKTFCQAFTTPDENGTVVDFEGVRKSPTKAWGSGCESWMLPALNNNFTDPVTGEAGVFDGTESWNEFTPKVGLSYDFSDTGMVYVSYTEGFRSGGFNGRATGAANAGPYEPEIVESWEFGFKTSWRDNTLQLNGAIFTTDYQDKQEDVVLPGTDGAVTLTLVQNAAAASLDGFELESIWIPVEGLTLTANMGYLDASYDNYIVSDPAGLPLDKSGFELRKAPELNYAIGGTYEWALANDSFVVAAVNYRWKDDYAVNASYGGPKHYSADPLIQDAYGILDASVNFETENWRLSFFGKNLTDESYFYHVLDVAAGYSATSATDATPVYNPGLWTFGTMNRPRYFGAEIQYVF